MLTIECKDIAKRFNKEVLFKKFNYTFSGNTKYALLGYNSSGKSTLLKIIGGVLTPTKGDVTYSPLGTTESLFSFCSPEMHLLDDYTVRELFKFHFSFKKPKISIEEQWNQSILTDFLDKKYSELSSGLKNKVKLALALFTDAPALLLDEPCSNFDDINTLWYNQMIKKHWDDRMVIVASNQEIEYKFCQEMVNL
ncbi:MAG: ATP-binding cassette domain-containing protein, partial [Bacteroidia bacterium]|nr:ATP-binding cassette domain-containing protein [Bacteroidia bacterium]